MGKKRQTDKMIDRTELKAGKGDSDMGKQVFLITNNVLGGAIDRKRGEEN